ncbi:MAG TPA: hypothetical protein VNZ61_02940 [Roseomonas sp.]|nr:hypothetical protein [Roseomonas sp.]
MSAASTSLSAKSGDTPSLPRFIYAGTDADHGPELWTSDGTEAGTHLLKDIWPGAHGSDVGDVTRLADGRLVFTAQDPEHGYELWVTDGTTDGTTMLYDVGDGDGSYWPANLTTLSDGRIVFTGRTVGTGEELWITDGTREGTRMLVEVTPGAEGTAFNGYFHALPDGRFLFGVKKHANDTSFGAATLWVSDGTPEGTVALSDWTVPRYSVLLDDGRFFFKDGDQIKVTDGTPQGTHAIEGLPDRKYIDIEAPIGMHSALIDVPNENGSDLWVTDGVVSRKLVKASFGAPYSFHDLGNGKVVFSTTDTKDYQTILTDGTEEGTIVLASKLQGLGAGLGPVHSLGDGRGLALQKNASGEVHLVVVGEDGITDVTDTLDIPAGRLITSVSSLSDGTFVFKVKLNDDGLHQIWRTDLTSEGTQKVGELTLDLTLSDNLFELIGTPKEPEPPTPPTVPEEPSGPSAPHHEWAAGNALFDVPYYLDNNKDVATSSMDALEHFMRFGAAEGRDPNAFFDVSFYLNQNPDVLAAGVNALEHYMASGWHEGRAASFAFDGDAYLAANPDVAAAGMDPLLHYLHYGEAEHRAAPQATPHATGPQNVLVDASFYFSTYADVAREGVDPTQHFMATGWQEGRDPNAFFDTDWYLAHNTDVATARVNPLEHYLRFGAEEGRDPSAAFDGEAYLAHNPDVAAAGMNPLAHYLAYGIAEHRDVFTA